MSYKRLRDFLRPFKIPSVSRISLNIKLYKVFSKVKQGKVLDIGAKNSPYRKRIKYTEYITMDIDARHNPDIISDIHDIKSKSAMFDTVIATEVLEHCRIPTKAVAELYRVLKVGGICILSTRFIHEYHPMPNDYYRFTTDSLQDIFKEFSSVKVIPIGNRLHVMWNLLSIGYPFTPLALLNPFIARIDFRDLKYPTGFLVVARK